MEAFNASRQARLRSLRQTKDHHHQHSAEDEPSTSTKPSSSSIHPFRRAFLSQHQSTIRPTRSQHPLHDEDDDDNDAGTGEASSESATQRLINSTAENRLLLKFRNWDPMTSQPRSGLWSTISGIEDEIKDVQSTTLKEEEERRRRELDLSGIAPKRINWDLKRDLNRRLKKLEKRDREVRLILIRQRIKAMSNPTSSSSSSSSNQKSSLASQALAAEVAMSTVARGSSRLGVGELESESDSSSEEEEEEEDGERGE